MAITRIDDYTVFYSSNAFQPRIELLNAGKLIGQLFFYPNGEQLPSDGLLGGEPTLYYHLEDFENCAALLRNEKTVFLLYSGAGPGFENGLQTAETSPGT
jgi:hypothetical protein